MKPTIQVHNYERKLKATLERLSGEAIPEQDRKAILDFHEYLVAQGMSIPRRERVISFLATTARQNAKPFQDFARDDVQKLVAKLESSQYAEWTKYTYKVMVKQFFRWLRGLEGTQNPPETAWISTRLKNAKKLLPEDLLTEEEIKRLFAAAKNPRDKALIMVLYDSGCRIGEILSMRLKDVVADEKGFYLIVNGKTGARRVRLMPSVASLANWLNHHPQRNEPQAPVWIEIKGDSHDSLSYDYTRLLLKRLFAHAGIRKRSNPHLFRHSRATFYAANLPESLLKEQMGWAQTSKMAGTYVHLSGKNVDDALTELYGGKKEKRQPALTIKTCPRCDFTNDFNSQHCGRCGTALDLSAVIRSDSDEAEFLANLFKTLLEDQSMKRKIGEILNNSHLGGKLLELIKTKKINQ